MTTSDDGGPAFPPNAGWRDNDHECRGMSLRDWFAGEALSQDDWCGTADEIARRCYQLADALLRARQERDA